MRDALERVVSGEGLSRRQWAITAGAGCAVLVLLLTTVAAIASTFRHDEPTVAGCRSAVARTKPKVEAQVARVVQDRAQLSYESDCVEGDRGGVGGVTSDTATEIVARMKRLGDVKNGSNKDCVEAEGEDLKICDYLIYRPADQLDRFFVRLPADAHDEFSFEMALD